MTDARTTTTASRGQPRPVVRSLLSLLIAAHILAVFVGPWAMPPSSELAVSCARLFRPYLEALCLANGYRFFAPEPGPSHLVRYEITLDDGEKVEGKFPDRSVQFPRLLYHRYFMLSEFINILEVQPEARERAEAYAKSYADHLMHQYQAQDVKLYLQRHYVPRPIEAQGGMSLTDKRLYDERQLGVRQAGEK